MKYTKLLQPSTWSIPVTSLMAFDRAGKVGCHHTLAFAILVTCSTVNLVFTRSIFAVWHSGAAGKSTRVNPVQLAYFTILEGIVSNCICFVGSISKKNLEITESLESRLQDIHHLEADMNFILSIREEIIDRVMDECLRIYMEKQIVKFLVQCSYDAFIQFLSFDFYYHPEIPDPSDPIWRPDEPIDPSPKDTWARDASSLTPANYEGDIFDTFFDGSRITGLDDTTETTKTNLPKSKPCSCSDRKCDCMLTTDEIIEKLQAKCDGDKPSTLRTISIQEKVESDIISLSSTKLDPSTKSIEVESTEKEPESDMTLVSEVAFTENSTLDIDERMDIPSKLQQVSEAIPFPLPSIRIDSTLQSMPMEPRKKR